MEILSSSTVRALARSNLGAMQFLIELSWVDLEKLKTIVHKIKNSESLRGNNLYVLYSKLCEKNMDKVCQLFDNCPIDVIEEACSRDDDSGCELIAEYFTLNEV